MGLDVWGLEGMRYNAFHTKQTFKSLIAILLELKNRLRSVMEIQKLHFTYSKNRQA